MNRKGGRRGGEQEGGGMGMRRKAGSGYRAKGQEWQGCRCW